MKKVVITGGTGFIGLWLVREMLVHDIEVIVLVRDLNMTKFESVEKKQTLRLVQYHTEEGRYQSGCFLSFGMGWSFKQRKERRPDAA